MMDKQFIYDLILNKLANMTVDEVLNKIAGIKPISFREIERLAERLVKGELTRYDPIEIGKLIERMLETAPKYDLYRRLQVYHKVFKQIPYTKNIIYPWENYTQLLSGLLHHKAAPASYVRDAALQLAAVYSKDPWIGRAMAQETPKNLFEEMMKFLPESMSKEIRGIDEAGQKLLFSYNLDFVEDNLRVFKEYLEARGKTLADVAPGGIYEPKMLENMDIGLETVESMWAKPTKKGKFPWGALAIGTGAGLGALALNALIGSKKQKKKRK